jgi:maltose phosphorylase
MLMQTKKKCLNLRSCCCKIKKNLHQKLAGYTVSLNQWENTQSEWKCYKSCFSKRIRPTLQDQIMLGQKFGKWVTSTIDGDVKAQQGIVSIFSVKSNVFRKRKDSTKYWTKRIYWRKIWWITYWDTLIVPFTWQPKTNK